MNEEYEINFRVLNTDDWHNVTITFAVDEYYPETEKQNEYFDFNIISALVEREDGSCIEDLSEYDLYDMMSGMDSEVMYKMALEQYLSEVE